MGSRSHNQTVTVSGCELRGPDPPSQPHTGVSEEVCSGSSSANGRASETLRVRDFQGNSCGGGTEGPLGGCPASPQPLWEGRRDPDRLGSGAAAFLGTLSPLCGAPVGRDNWPGILGRGTILLPGDKEALGGSEGSGKNLSEPEHWEDKSPDQRPPGFRVSSSSEGSQVSHSFSSPP